MLPPRSTPTAVLCELTKLRSQQNLLDTTAQHDAHLWPSSSGDIPFLRQQLAEQLAEFRNAKWTAVQHLSDAMRTFRERMLCADGIRKHKTIDYRAEVLRVDGLLRDAISRNGTEMAELTERGVSMRQLEDGYKADVLLSTGCPKALGAAKRSTGAAAGNVVNRQDNAEVRRFFDYVVRHGGHSGGWSAEEHLRFVRLKTKHGARIEQLVDAMIAENTAVGRVEEDIRRHFDWYEKYIVLKKKYRDAVANWKDGN